MVGVVSNYIYGFDAAKLESPEVLRDFLEHLRVLKETHGNITVMLTRPSGTPIPFPVKEP